MPTLRNSLRNSAACDLDQSGDRQTIYFNHPGLDTDADPESKYIPGGVDFASKEQSVNLQYGSLRINEATSIVGPRDPDGKHSFT